MSKKSPKASPADQEPSRPVQRDDEGPFPQASQPATHVDWDEGAEAPRFHMSTNLSIIFNTNVVRLMGLKSLGPK